MSSSGQCSSTCAVTAIIKRIYVCCRRQLVDRAPVAAVVCSSACLHCARAAHIGVVTMIIYNQRGACVLPTTSLNNSSSSSGVQQRVSTVR
eukprot:14253-Heterococcus_DN1.PRE.2